MILRKATIADADFIYKLRNDPCSRKFQKNTKAFSYSAHLKWFKDSLKNSRRFIFIFLDKGKKVGITRLDLTSSTAVISVAISKNLRGKGMGTLMIMKSCKLFFSLISFTKISAFIDVNNVASLIAFLKAKFQFVRILKKGKRKYVEMALLKKKL